MVSFWWIIEHRAGTILDGDWHLMTYTQDSSENFALYIDDQLKTTGQHTPPSGTSTEWVLGGAACNNDPFNGDMAYLVVYETGFGKDAAKQGYSISLSNNDQTELTMVWRYCMWA